MKIIQYANSIKYYVSRLEIPTTLEYSTHFKILKSAL